MVLSFELLAALDEVSALALSLKHITQKVLLPRLPARDA
jgi:hypothetical protein